MADHSCIKSIFFHFYEVIYLLTTKKLLPYWVQLMRVSDFSNVFLGNKKCRRIRFWVNLNPASGSSGDILRFGKFSERKILIFVHFLTKKMVLLTFSRVK